MLHKAHPCCLLLLVAIAGWTVSLAPAEQSAVQQLSARVDEIVTHADFRGAMWGIQVIDPATNHVLYEHNPTKALVPASNVKIYTTAAALDQLGPTFSVSTRLYGQGTVRSGVLEGNLFIRGAGDPTIADNLPVYGQPGVLATWTSAVRIAGIERVNGDIVGDDDVFDDAPYPAGWQWDDLTYYYAPEISGLTYNQNVIDILVEPRAVGMPGRIRWTPVTSFVQVKNETLTVNRGQPLQEGYYRNPGTNYFVISTRIPVGRTDPEALAIHNPTLFVAHRLVEVMQESGIGVDGQAVDVDDLSIKPQYADPSFFVISSHESPELSEIAALVNKPSHNLAAEMLLKLLGVHSIGESDGDAPPGSTAAGIERIALTMLRAGVDTSAVRLVDGSGLSRLNLVTAEATARMLSYMWRHATDAVREAFVASLSVGGIDGTLRDRYSSETVHGRVRARTGTLSSVSSLGGYVETSSGRTLVFALMCNNYLVPSRRVRAAQDDVVNLLARL